MSVKTYELIPKPSDGAAIQCLVCGLTSHQPEDRRHLYCGNCHEYHARLGRMGASLDEIRRNASILKAKPEDYGKMKEIYHRVREGLDLAVVPGEHTGSYTREQQLPPEPLDYVTLDELREKVDKSVSGHLKAFGEALYELPPGESMLAGVRTMETTAPSDEGLSEMVHLQLAAYVSWETNAQYTRELMEYRQELAKRLIRSDDLFENETLRHSIQYINEKLRAILAL